jgi:hypothetical protein
MRVNSEFDKSILKIRAQRLKALPFNIRPCRGKTRLVYIYQIHPKGLKPSRVKGMAIKAIKIKNERTGKINFSNP